MELERRLCWRLWEGGTERAVQVPTQAAVRGQMFTARLFGSSCFQCTLLMNTVPTLYLLSCKILIEHRKICTMLSSSEHSTSGFIPGMKATLQQDPLDGRMEAQDSQGLELPLKSDQTITLVTLVPKKV
ncbi:hypothetical protein AV530_014928 [Patagioenas fasciata monilis]|uniref:Uncharacterized protein n=1 Tax=Patagioenas fasciata monilis TaxID=372326 RepID=A0A1V4K0J8_PATFA|nr:hypothetical protein AV530_014928 [Patagioenas fasciata monilis]